MATSRATYSFWERRSLLQDSGQGSFWMSPSGRTMDRWQGCATFSVRRCEEYSPARPSCLSPKGKQMEIRRHHPPELPHPLPRLGLEPLKQRTQSQRCPRLLQQPRRPRPLHQLHRPLHPPTWHAQTVSPSPTSQRADRSKRVKES